MEESKLTPATLFGSDRTKPCVRQVYGISGTGKSVFLCESLRKAARMKDFGEKHRFIVFDIKHEGYETLAPPVFSVGHAIKKLDKDRVVVIHPDMATADEELDDIINYLFELSEFDPEFSATFILEESSTFITSSVHGIPRTIKRFATQGRSKGLSLILVNQRSLSSKWTDTQSSSITMFRLAIPDRKLLLDRWGLNAEEVDSKVAEQKFSFAHFDLESLDLSFYNAVKIPKLKTPIVQDNRKRMYSKLFRMPFN